MSKIDEVEAVIRSACHPQNIKAMEALAHIQELQDTLIVFGNCLMDIGKTQKEVQKSAQPIGCHSHQNHQKRARNEQKTTKP